MTTKLITATLAAAGLVSGSASASCVAATQAERDSLADAVFVGRVLSVNEDRGTARFQILAVRKGDLAKDATVRVLARPLRSSVTTGWTPEAGERWRVAVQRKRERWVTNDCLGTRRTS